MSVIKQTLDVQRPVLVTAREEAQRLVRHLGEATLTRWVWVC